MSKMLLSIRIKLSLVIMVIFLIVFACLGHKGNDAENVVLY